MNEEPWNIVYYESARGDKLIEEFINTLQEKTQIKVIRSIELLKKYGIRLGPPHIKKIRNTSLWEIRILGSDNIRVFYVTQIERTFLILHIFKKKTQKTEIQEINTAIKRLNNYKFVI